MVDVTKLLTVREAARRLDLTEERVRELITGNQQNNLFINLCRKVIYKCCDL